MTPPDLRKKSCIGQKCKLLCANVPKASASGGLRAADPLPELCPLNTLGIKWQGVPLLQSTVVFSNDVCNAPNSWRTRNQRHGFIWLEDIDNNFGPDLPLLFKMHEIWLVNSQENYKNCSHQLLDFKAKMHQIRFRMGLRQTPLG